MNGDGRHAEVERMLAKARAREAGKASIPARPRVRPLPVECVSRPRRNRAELRERPQEAAPVAEAAPRPARAVVRWWNPDRNVIYSITDPDTEAGLGFAATAADGALTWEEALGRLQERLQGRTTA